MSKTIPANQMSVGDQQTHLNTIARVEKQWTLCSWLAFEQDGELHLVCVGQKPDDNDYYYVFRAYSTHDGIEYESRHKDKAEAIAARFAACEGHADIIYDNSKEKR